MSGGIQSIGYSISDIELQIIASDLASARPEEILRWSLEMFGPEVALATGFGAEGCVLVSMLAQIDRKARLFYLDTDLLFPETYALRDELERRYGVVFERRSTSLSID